MLNRRSRYRARRRLVAGAVWVLMGCYSYQPVVTDVSPGTPVSCVLTDAGSLALGPLIGPTAARVDGRLIELSDTTLIVAVTAVRDRSGEDTYWKGERVVLRRTDVASIRRERLSTVRTIGAVGVAVAIAALAVGLVAGAGGSGGSGGRGVSPGSR